MEKIIESFHLATGLTRAMAEILQPMTEAATFRLEDGGNIFTKDGEMPFIFWGNPLTQLSLQLTIELRGKHGFA
jgi:hypothetical protein